MSEKSNNVIDSSDSEYDSMIDDSSDWDDEEWEELVGGKDNRDILVDWMAPKCPNNIILHTCSLEDDLRNMLGDKYYQQTYERAETQLWKDFEKDHPELCQKFKEKREEYEEKFEDSILGDFFIHYRKPWMVVGNMDVRNAVKDLKHQDGVYDIARVHRKIFMANINLTEFTSRVLQEPNADPFLVLSVSSFIEESITIAPSGFIGFPGKTNCCSIKFMAFAPLPLSGSAMNLDMMLPK